MDKNLLSIQEAAKLLKVSTKTLRRWEEKGILVPNRTKGSHRRYARESVDQFWINLSEAKKNHNPQFEASQEAKPFNITRPVIEAKEVLEVKAQEIIIGQTTSKYILSRKIILVAAIAIFITFLGLATFVAANFIPGFGVNISNRDKGIAERANFKNNVLGLNVGSSKYIYRINIPTYFSQNAEFLEGISVLKLATTSGGIDTRNSDIDAGSGSVFASNLIYGLTAGTGITVGAGQNPVITNTGVLSVGGKTGVVTFTAGTGITISGTTITNSAPDTITDSFKNIVIGSDTLTAEGGEDTLTFSAGAGIYLSASGSGKTIRITSDPVMEVTSGFLHPGNSTVDFGIGGYSTASAKFSILNVNSGTPIASISANSGNIATYITGDGNLQTTNGQSLILGGSTSGLVQVNNKAGSAFTTFDTVNSRVGIGTALPTADLSVAASGIMNIQNANSGYQKWWIDANSNGLLKIGGNGTIQPSIGAININYLSNVGIGTTGPSGLLSLGQAVQTNKLLVYDGGAGATNNYGLGIATATLQIYSGSETNGKIAFGSYNGTSFSELMRLQNNGLVGLGTTTPASELHVTRALSAGATGKSLVIFDQIEDQDIFAASKSGVAKFAVGSSGEVKVGSGLLSAGTSGYCLVSGGSGSAVSWGACQSSTADALWTQSGGALFANNSTVDLLIGGQATASAKFGFLNVATGTPTASISANSGNIATYITGDGTLATTNRQSLTIGNSSTYSTTGNVLINPNGSGNVGIGTANPTTVLQVMKSGVFSGSVTSDLVGVIGQTSAANNPASLAIVSGSTGNASLFLGGNGATSYNNGRFTYDSTTNALGIFTSDTEQLTITSTGNVGIGTTAPGQKLQVIGGIISGDGSRVGDPTAGPSAGMNYALNDSAVNAFGIGLNAIDSNSKYNMWFQTGNINGGGFRWYTGTSEKMRIDSVTGNVGIGTTTPTALLHVNGGYSNNAALIVNNLNSGDIFTASAGGTTRFVIDNSGNVGINTANPNATLEVLTTDGGSVYTTGGGGLVSESAFFNAQGRARFGYSGSRTAVLIDDAGLGGTSSTKTIIFENAGLERLRISTSGLIGVGSASPVSELHVTRALSAGVTGKALAIFDQIENQDIFTASKSGVAKFAIGSSGEVKVGSGLLSAGTIGNCLVSGGSGGAVAWGSCALGSNLWQVNSGAISPVNNTYDLLIGGTATTSALFAFTGLSSSTNQTQASISGQLIVMPNNGYSGRVGIGTTAPLARLHVSTQLEGEPASLGLGQLGSSFILASSTNLYGLYAGIRTNGDTWLQSTRNDGTATAYNILLNPSGGNVGIGTTAPGMRAHVSNSTANAQDGLKIEVTNGAGAQARLQFTNASLGYLVYLDSGGRLGFYNGSAETVSILNNGNLGVGTTAPTSALYITRPLSLGVTGKALAVFDQIENQDIFTASKSGVTKFVIDTNGNVGIGDATPNSVLDIAGDLIVGDETTTTEYGITFQNSTVTGASTNGWARIKTAGTTDGRLQIFTNLTGAGLTEKMSILRAGQVGLGTTSPISELHVTRALTQGATGKALAIFDQIENQDIFTASKSGVTQFRIASDGDLLPGTDITQSIGASSSGRFKDLFVGPSSLHVQCTTGDGCGAGGLDYALGVNTSTGTFSIGVNGTSAVGNPLLNIMQGGNVGIGTTTPSSILEVYGANPLITYNRAGAYRWEAGVGGTGGIPTSFFGIRDISNNAVRLTIAHTTGNVGIGTTSPSKALEVKTAGANNASITAYSDTYGGYIGTVTGSNDSTLYLQPANQRVSIGDGVTTNNLLAMYNGATQNVQINSNGISYLNGGNVGIGTTTPTALLDVAGTASLSANLSMRGASTAHTFNILDNGTLNIQRSAGGDAGLTTALFVQNNGNVGFGTNAPTSRISLSNSWHSASAETVGINLYETVTAGGLPAYGLGFGPTATEGFVTYRSGTGSTNVFGHKFFINNIERLRINGLGNVGIGTNAPSGALHVTKPLSFGATGKALAIFDQIEDQDIFTASKSGVPQFVIDTNGSVLAGGITRRTPVYAGFDSQTPSIIEVGYGTSTASDTPFAGLTISKNLTGTNTYLGSIFFVNSSIADGSEKRLVQIGVNTDGAVNSGRLAISTVNAGSVVERMRITSTGLIGLGSIAPASQLHVTRPLSFGATGKALAIFDQIENQDIFTASAGGVTKFTISNAGSVTASSSIVSLSHVQSYGNLYGDDLYLGFDGTSSTIRSYDTNENISIIPNGTGNVGIGTTNPTNSYLGTATKLMIETTRVAANQTLLQLHTSGTTVAGDQMNISFDSQVSDAGNRRTIAQISAIAENPAAGNFGALAFYTSPSAGALTEKMHIDSAGNVGIGTTAPANRLSVAGSGTSLFHFLGEGNTYYTLRARNSGDTAYVDTVLRTDDFVIETGTTGSVTERFRITDTGLVGIGMTATEKLSVNGKIKLYDDIKSIATRTSVATATQLFAGETSDSAGYGTAVGYWLDGGVTWRGVIQAWGGGVGITLGINPSGGNVGIGTTGPTAQLDVKGAADTADQISLQLRSGNTASNFNSNQITFGYGNTDTYRHAIKSRHNSGAQVGNSLDFFLWNYGTDPNTAIGTKQVMTLDGNGNVGIGTTSPNSLLTTDVNTGTIATGLQLANSSTNATAGRGSQILFTGTGGGWLANIRGSTTTTSNQTGKLDFQTSNGGVLTTAMTINELGNVGIGTATPTLGTLQISSTVTTSSYGFYLASNFTGTSGTTIGQYIANSANPSGTSTATDYGLYVSSSYNQNQTGTGATQLGIYGQVSNGGGNTLGTAIANQGQVLLSNSSTITNGYALFGQSPNIAAGSVLTNAYGLNIATQANTNGASSTTGGYATYGINLNLGNQGGNTSGTNNNYGLYLTGNGGTAGGGGTVNNYAIYSNSTANSYFAGNVGIGSGATTPGNLLHVDNGSTGGITIGGYNTSTKSLFLRNLNSIGGAQNYQLYSTQNTMGLTKPAATAADLARYDISEVGSINSINPFWSGIHLAAPGGMTVGGSPTYARTSLYHSYTSAADPTDLTFNITTGNTTSKYSIALNSSNNGNIILMPAGTGNVGIGVTDPNTKLEVGSAAQNTELLRLRTAYTGDSTARGAIRWFDTADISGQIDSRFNGTQGMMVFGHLYNSGYQTTDILTLLGNGNVGIGTATPGEELHVLKTGTGVTGGAIIQGGDGNSTSNVGQLILRSLGGGGGNVDAVLKSFYNGATYALNIDTVAATYPIALSSTYGSNVGIGLANPASPLHVSHGLALAATGKALVTFDQYENQDIFTASASGTSRFTIANNGGITQTTTASTGNGYTMNLNSLSTGTGLSLLSTSTALSTGSLMSMYWNPGSATTATGDLLSLDVGSNGILGNIFNVKDNGSSLFSISQSQITANLPVAFTAPGDVAIAYDINFTNPTASYIKSAAPLYIWAGETFNSTDLTLGTYNKGNVIVDSEAFSVTGSATVSGSLGIGTAVPSSKLHVAGGDVRLDDGQAFIIGSGSVLARANTETYLRGNTIVFQNDATTNNWMYINATGNVGIGTITPASALHVTRPLSFGATGKALAIFDQIENQDIFTASASGTTRFVIQNDGDVGIGTTTPASKLNVYSTTLDDGLLINGNARPRLVLDSGNTVKTRMYHREGGWYAGGISTNVSWPGQYNLDDVSRAAWQIDMDADSDYFRVNHFTAGANPRTLSTFLHMNSAGNVGIGTASPISQLHVTRPLSFGATGKALVTFNQIENQDIFTASASGTTRFVIQNDGDVGIGTTAPESKLQVTGGGLCVGSDANCNTDNNTEGTVYAATTAMTVYDVAENYPTKDTSLVAGEVVTMDSTRGTFVQRSSTPYDPRAIGAISAEPGVLLGGFNGAQFKEERQVAVALTGRILVKASNENGEIKQGDFVTSSSTPGKIMKATKAGAVIGQALENWDQSKDSVMIFIKSTYHDPDVYLTDSGDFSIELSKEQLASSLGIRNTQTGEEINRIGAFKELVAGKIRSGNIETKTITTDSLNITTDQITIDDKTLAEYIDERLLVNGANASVEDRIVSLENQVASLSASQGLTLRGYETLGVSTQSAELLALQEKISQVELEIALLNATHSASFGSTQDKSSGQANLASSSANAKFETLRTTGNALVEGILTVLDTLNIQDLIVNGASTFFGEVVFKDNVRFDGSILFGKDTSGSVVVKQGTTKVNVTFSKPYDYIPDVSATIQANGTAAQKQALLNQNYSVAVTDITEEGFTIILNKIAATDVRFSWIAIQSQ